MKIAQVAPLYEAVPPKMYGGTERIVSHLTEELVRQGHQVTLFAAGDSITTARLIPICRQGLRMDTACIDPITYHIVQVQEVIDRASQFDIIHFHTDYLHFPASQCYGYNHVTTLHGRLDLPDLQPLYRKFSAIPLISISNSQRIPIPFANWITTIYHGLPLNLYHAGKGEGNYLAFIGRISPEKRVDLAIEIAKKTGIRLKIAAKIDNADKEYFESKIRHLLNDPLVEFIGEISEDQKSEFLGNAIALLFPIDWPEPFGLVLIESMACGTPVIAFTRGSVTEIIDESITGYKVNTVDQAADAVNKLHLINRRECRRRFEERFGAPGMAHNYIKVYEHLIEKKSKNMRLRTNTF